MCSRDAPCVAFMGLFVVVGSSTVEALVGSVAPNLVGCQALPPAVAASSVWVRLGPSVLAVGFHWVRANAGLLVGMARSQHIWLWGWCQPTGGWFQVPGCWLQNQGAKGWWQLAGGQVSPQN